jgi:glycosyltransferase involved in cell wall biosynthesis
VRVLFIYIGVADGFSGQSKATDLIIDGLNPKGVVCVRGLLPYLDRSGLLPVSISGVSLFAKLLRVYWRFLCERLPEGGAIHLSLGLTRFALLRDYVALICASLFARGRVRKVVALHGSVFTEWPINSLNAQLLRSVIRYAGCVTCVGSSHRQALINLGVSSGKIEIVPNACEYDGIEESDVTEKQASSDQPLECLFLSSLTDTKGYPEYLEALEIIGSVDGAPIHAVLCGPIMMDAYRKRFDTYDEAKVWIEQKVASINESDRVQAEWIPGARGSEKKALFEQAQIFVLPTQYPVEAQPLAVIEAMAHGCAIATTDAGELLSTVNDESAIILSAPTPDSVKQSIISLAEDEQLRLRLSQAALNQFKLKFNRERYVQRWADLLGL